MTLKNKSMGLVFLAGLVFSSHLYPVLACTIVPPLQQRNGESDQVIEERRAQDEAEKLKTPEQRELEQQAWRWNNSDSVFLARVDKIKLNGKTYPAVAKPLKKKRNDVFIPPPAPIIIPLGSQHSAYIQPIRILKGDDIFKASWHNVGGINSCGAASDGSLGFSYPESNVIIFANWATSSQRVNGEWVVTKYLSLYGINPDQAMSPELLAMMPQR